MGICIMKDSIYGVHRVHVMFAHTFSAIFGGCMHMHTTSLNSKSVCIPEDGTDPYPGTFIVLSTRTRVTYPG